MWENLVFVFLLSVQASLALKHGDVRLIGSTSANKGFLQAFDSNTLRWGYVCDDGGRIEQLGHVVCRNLGESYINATINQKAPSGQSFPSESYDFALDDVVCTGDEDNLDQCRHEPWWTDNCSSSELVSVECTESGTRRKTGDVRLVNGTSKYEGLLQVFDSHDGYLSKFQRWGYVCDDGGGIEKLGQVVCRNLGQNYINSSDEQHALDQIFPTEPYDFALDDVVCTGTEDNLDQCSHKPWWTDNCESYELVWVKCTDNSTECGNPSLNSCEQICTMTALNNYTCSCHPGYSLDDDGYSCSDINECSVTNGGCSHECKNTVGSYDCHCPSYMNISSDDPTTCTFPDSAGSEVKCLSEGMKITYRKKEFFFLPDQLSLANNDPARCLSSSNSTHIWLYTDYNECGTTLQNNSDALIYTNYVKNLPHSEGAIKFFDSIKIPVKCTIWSNKSIELPVVTPELLIMRIDATGTFSSSLGTDKSSYKQGEEITATFDPSPSYSSPINSTVQCEVTSSDGTQRQQLIKNGDAASFITETQESSRTDRFLFNYKVFAFHNKNSRVNLQCNSSIKLDKNRITSVANSSLIITQKDIDSARLQLKTGSSSTAVIDPSNVASLTCTNSEMQLRLKPSVGDIRYSTLAPLNGRFYSHSGYFRVPLFDSGGQVEVKGDSVTFTNSLIYHKDIPLEERKYKNVIFTVSCTYKLTDVKGSDYYRVQPSDFRWGMEDGKEPTLDIKLNLFTDGTFTQIIPTGQIAGTWNVDKIYGGVHITNSQPNLRVRLDTCRVQSSATGEDSKGTVIIENGCRTQFGAFLTSDTRFIADLQGLNTDKNVYVHCSVMMCDNQSSNSRCNRPCLSNGAGGAIGKRDTDDDEDVRIVNVKAGPFSFH